MVHASGIARIKHAKTGTIYEIDSDMLDFDVVGLDERGMGPETAYSAVIHHPQLGQIVWSLWEYPVGAENYRKTDVGIHELIEDLEVELTPDPPEEEDDPEDRIDSMVAWFHERYEDPAHQTPYESKEGGYQWICGGPYDAREVMGDNFSYEAENIIESAVADIESDGLIDWAKIPMPDEHNVVPLEVNDLENIGGELERLISTLPEAQIYPVFSFGNDGLLHMASPADQQSVESEDVLLEELRVVTDDLRQSLSGTNAHTALLNAVERYESALLGDTLSISRLYARGVRFENAAKTTGRCIETDDLPPLSLNTEQYLNSVLHLHHAYIMSHEDGISLAEGADAYHHSSQETEEFKKAALRFVSAIEQKPELFGEDVREYIPNIVQDIGEGPQPERSNQIAVKFIENMLSGIFRGCYKVGGITISAAIGGALVTSIPGGSAVTGGTIAIDTAWEFLIVNAPLLKTIAVATGSDLSWLTSLSYLLDRIRLYRRQ